MRLGAKLIVAMTALVVIVAFLFSLFFMGHERKLIEEELKKRALTIAWGVADNCAYGVLTEDRPILEGFLQGALLQKDVVYAAIFDDRGKVLAKAPESSKPVLSKEESEAVAMFTAPVVRRLVDPLTLDLLVPVRGVPPEEFGTAPQSSPKGVLGVVRVGISLASVEDQLRLISERVIYATLLIVAFGLFLGWLLARRILTPVEELLGVTEAVGRGDLTAKVRTIVPDEIGDLAVAFNEMTHKLAVSQDEIQAYSRTLEERVGQRTLELERANRELKDAQTQLIQSAKMTAIGELGAGVAHELNNPLGGILGYTQMLREKMKKGSMTEQEWGTSQEYLSHIERESRRCKGIVENLLNFSPRSLEVKVLDVRKVIQETLNLLDHQLTLENIELIIGFDHDLAWIEGNPNELQQVFTNIILNAQQAMVKGGVLRILGRNRPEPPDLAREVELEFTDTGPGIAPEYLAKIFDPFFTTKQERKGTGLGLSITYQIVQAHHGTIEAKSVVGKGASFFVRLPAVTAGSPASTSSKGS